MRWLALILIPGCLYFDSDEDGGGTCALDAEARFDPAPLRSPYTLQCEPYGGGCNPACGPCPLDAPEVTWGVCGSPCEGLGQSECEADPECRVILHAECEIGLDCFTNYLGCFPVDRAPDASIDCFNADAWSCSRSNECTALHSQEPCTTDAPCDQPFELCVPEGTWVGRCHDTALCPSLPPDCPPGTTPGVAEGCWSGACIPDHLCEEP